MGQPLVSYEFLIFIAVVFIAYYGLCRAYQWQLLLIVSYLFYALNSRWEYVILLGSVTGINFLMGVLIHGAIKKSTKKIYLLLGIGLNTLVLLIFKYSHSLGISRLPRGSEISKLGGALVVPLGISYFTFKAISYCVDIYRNKQKQVQNFGKFALYLSFFPEIYSGPIDRAGNLLPQMDSPKIVVYDTIASGLRLMLWGFFKKIVVANNLAIYVNQIYGSPRDYPGIPLFIANYFLAFQLYTDFSGYTDIVRGVGRLLGYDMPENFKFPYFSKSISEFWTRWHITLSTWLRDYLFLPLSFFFSRRIKSDSVLTLDSNVIIFFSSALITFLIAGVWHGSAWTYIIWGLLHGSYLSLSNLTRPLRKQLKRRFPLHLRYPKLIAFCRVLFCFHIVLVTWIFFRASSIKDALYIIRNSIPVNFGGFLRNFLNPFELLNLEGSKYGFFFSIMIVILFILIEVWQNGSELPRFFNSRNRALRWATYYILLFLIFLFGEFGLREFIYIQF